MKLKIYQVDAFTDRIFAGNPAAVCPLGQWLPEDLMQRIAMENNLAETAFYVKNADRYDIRWFTPAVEVDLCGHATLASAYVLFNLEGHAGPEIRFHSHRSGKLGVQRTGNLLTLDFPADIPVQVPLTKDLSACFDILPTEVFKAKTDYMFVYRNENEVRNVHPDFEKITALGGRGVMITAPGNQVDFVSRFFAPQSGIPEDPVTGSAYTVLTPYWSEKFGRNEMSAIQLSRRGGVLKCQLARDRVKISGQCRLYLSGELFID